MPIRSPRSIAVIGAGVAGACVLRAVARASHALGFADLRLSLYERGSGPATAASSVPVAVVHPMASRDHNLASQFFLQGVHTLSRWIDDLQGSQQGWADLSGVDHREPHAGQTERQPGGWVVPIGLVQACLCEARAHMADRLQLNFNCAVLPADLSALIQTHDAVVICTAADGLLPDAGLALQPLSGQVSWVSATKGQDAIRSLIPRVVSGEGFLTPLISGRVQFGATFHRSDSPPPVSLADHRRNIAQLHRLAPDVAQRLAPQPEHCGGWAGTRAATRDRLPHIGQPVCPTVYKGQTDRWQLVPSVSQLHQLPRHAGIYVLVGLGARGLSTAALGAEVIAAEVLGTPPILAPRICRAVDPGRFVLREHARVNARPKQVD